MFRFVQTKIRSSLMNSHSLRSPDLVIETITARAKIFVLNCSINRLRETNSDKLYTNILINVYPGSSGHQSIMASAPAPSVASTKKTTNYARLCRLLVDVGSQALMDTFNRIHPPPGLHSVLAPGTPAHRILQPLRKKKILNPTQWTKLYPAVSSSVSSASFDITLLVVLLRNICNLTPPATGWDILPPPADMSTEANIARVKYYRNTVYGHATKASVDDVTFNILWKDIRKVLVALGGACYGAAIDKLLNESMDPDIEEYYKELLKEWTKYEDSIKEKLEKMEGM